MAHVLWVSTETPAQNGQGGQRRQFHQIKALLARGHEITVLVPSVAQNDASIRSLVRVIRPRISFRGRLLEGRIHRMRRLVGSSEWDAIVVSHHESSWLLPHGSCAPVLLDIHNVMSHWLETTDRPVEARREKDKEAEAISRAAGVMTCSTTEMRRLLGVHPEAAGRVFAAPLGVDAAEWPDLPFSRTEPRVALFGTWSWDPNRAGLAWFAEEVWPRVRQQVPSAEGLVAGSGIADGLVWPDGLRFVGRVPDVARFTADATVVAVPVLDGVGASVKFAEALASGAAVIATVDGANAVDDPPAFVSDDPVDWSEWIVERLQHRTAEAVPDPARPIALTELTWDAAVEPIDRWLRDHARSGTRADSRRAG